MRTLLFTTAALAILAATPAAAQRVQVVPYVQVAQVADIGLSNDDTVTYTQVSAGVDATVNTARVSGQASYRYDRLIGESGHIGDSDAHTGLARVSYRVADPLTLEAGAIATRARSDNRGAAPLTGDTRFDDNVTEVYSLYAGPTLSTRAGALDIGASYRFGYTKAESPGSVTLAPGAPRLDYFDESTGHALGASVGVAPGRWAPFGVTLSGGWERDEASQLDQRFDNVFGRGDVLQPVSRTLALTAGVGWQKISVTQKDVLVDSAGAPVLDRNGRFETDEASPRRIAYRTDGLIYDVGVVWRPSRRTSLTATATHEYDSTAFTGSFGWQIEPGVTLGIDAYDGIETFGHQLRVGLQSLPTDFVTQRDSFGQQFNGCTFGAQTAQASGASSGGAGACLNDVFQSILTSSYRARGVDGVLVAQRGLNSFGVGAGYANRHLFAPQATPGIVVTGLDDDSWYLQGFWSRTLDRRSQIDANLFANWYDSALPGGATVFGAGATGAYSRNFGRVGTTAQLGVYTFDQPHVDDQWTAQALLGARYQF